MSSKTKKRLSLHDKAVIAMEEAVKKVMAEHKKTGRPVAVWRDGKLKYITIK